MAGGFAEDKGRKRLVGLALFGWGRRQTTTGRIDRSVKVSSLRRSGGDLQVRLAQVLSSVYGDVFAICSTLQRRKCEWDE